MYSELYSIVHRVKIPFERVKDDIVATNSYKDYKYRDRDDTKYYLAYA